MLLFNTQTAEEQAASEKALYAQKFRYGIGIAGTFGALLWAVQKNKKGKAMYAIGGLVGGFILGAALDSMVNKKAPVVVATATTPGAATASS